MLDYKELANPLVSFPIVITVAVWAGIRGRDIMIYSFLIFFSISVMKNMIIAITNMAKKRLYFFVYGAYLFNLMVIIPLFYFAGMKHPVISSVLAVSIADFIIQCYYNIFQRKDGKELLKLWKNKLVKSERSLFHPISLQKYVFREFTASITDSEAINPTNLHAIHLRPLMYEKIPSHIYKHQYLGRAYMFTLYTKKEVNSQNQTIGGRKINVEVMKALKDIDKEVFSHIFTAHTQGSNKTKSSQFTKNESALKKGKNDIRVCIEKGYVLNNPDKVYSFLSKSYKYFN